MKTEEEEEQEDIHMWIGCNGASIQRTAMLNGISYGSVKKFTEHSINIESDPIA